MVLEALAAVSLAGNIVQFVQFGCSLLSVSAKISHSEDGLSSMPSDLNAIAKDLEQFVTKLNDRHCSNAKLKFLSERCRKVAEELQAAVNKLRIKDRRGKQNSGHFREALVTIWNRNKIEDIARRLDGLRDQMQLHLISETRENQNKTMKMLDDLRVANMDASSQVIQDFSRIAKDLEAVQNHLKAGKEPISLQDLETSYSNFLERFENIAAYNPVLISLHFEAMPVRYAAISEAYTGTFKWIFCIQDLPLYDLRSKIKLSNWLEHGKGLYWVTGKPGSGKSTLMKFIEDDPRTDQLLRKWASPKRLIRASFYFWNAGTPLQKSLQGLLQSLLYHILKNCPELIEILCEDSRRKSSLHNLAYHHPWSVAELRRAFNRLKSQTSLHVSFYFHIDGIDEYEGDDHRELIDIFEDLAASPSIKLCLSSRPWNIFEDTLGQTNDGMLRLHELTRHDIESFARGALLASQPRRKPRRGRLDYYEELVDEITERAQGVFLWVRLVIRSLRDGIVNDDPVSLLQQRLGALPTDLEDFFELILNSVDKVYRKSMARTFLTAIANEGPLQIIHYSFIDEEKPNFGFESLFSKFDSLEIEDRVNETQLRLNGRYKGLLETSQTPLGLTADTKVEFLHRTLRDFLMTPRIRTILSDHIRGSFDASATIAQSLLAEAKYVKEGREPRHFHELLNFVYGTTMRGHAAIEHRILDHLELMFKEESYCWYHDQRLLDFSVLAVHNERLDYVAHRVARDQSHHCQHLGSLLGHALRCRCQSYPDDSSIFCAESWASSSFLNCKFVTTGQFFSHLKIILSLLDQGADPNVEFEAVSVWEEFMRDYYDVCFGQPDHQYLQVLQHWFAVFEAMIDHGANIHTAGDLWPKFLRSWATSANILPKHQFLIVDRILLMIFKKLLVHGLRPQSTDSYGKTLWNILLCSIAEPSFNQMELMRRFLEAGADVEELFRLESDAKRSEGFQYIAWIQRNIRVDEIVIGDIQLFPLILTKGAGPDRHYRHSSLWQVILDAIKAGLKTAASEQIEIYTDLLLLFMRQGADLTNKSFINLLAMDNAPKYMRHALRKEAERIGRNHSSEHQGPGSAGENR